MGHQSEKLSTQQIRAEIEQYLEANGLCLTGDVTRDGAGFVKVRFSGGEERFLLVVPKPQIA